MVAEKAKQNEKIRQMSEESAVKESVRRRVNIGVIGSVSEPLRL